MAAQSEGHQAIMLPRIAVCCVLTLQVMNKQKKWHQGMSIHSQSDPFPIEFLFSHLRRTHIMIRPRVIAVYSYFFLLKNAVCRRDGDGGA